MKKVKEFVKETKNNITEYYNNHEEEIYGFMIAMQIFWPWIATGGICYLAYLTKKPDKFLSKEFIKVIIENHKEEG